MHEKKGGILVHCGGGIGRAGSLLATYLIRYGLNAPPPVCTRCETRMPIHCDDTECALGMAPTMSAKDAIELLRSIRPQSIETTHQENFLSDFASELFRRAGTQTRLFSPLDVPSDAQPGQIRFTGERTPSPQVLILCGLPASGKSYFTSTLLASSAKWVSVSQDETGSLEACEREAGTLAAEVGTKCVVVDRCNPTAKERAAWIKLLGTPRGAVLVHFDADKESCVERASYRLAHPTVRANAAKSVVSSFAARFEKPTQSTEHKAFQAIYTVSSFADSISLLSHFGIKVPDDAAPAGFVKYPRTRHLFDLGAASRDDLILNDTETFLSAAARDPEAIFTIEEKVDGANVGFRLNSDGVKIIAQNRTHIVTSASHAQFAGLGAWVFRNQDALHRILAKGCILFGEWVVARHSVSYDLLPDVFVAFDIYDIREARFYSRMRFDAALEGSGISKVPRVDVSHLGMVTKEDLLRLIEEWSSFSSTERREGLVLRLDKQDHLMSKAKVVRPDFICGNDHWSKGIIEKNKIAWG
ncbi:hypothetical protein BC830DRAFT_686468 [Chytriomyces sp. MP71]|nr:hypothetical protein BC830DRAFT_686468 [Chytriomyces sp. MP71]